MYVVILAGSSSEAMQYAKRVDLPRGRFRYAAQAGTIRGLRVAEIHELPGFARRPDRHAINAVLRYTKGERIIISPEVLTRLTLEEALGLVADEANRTADELIEHLVGKSDELARDTARACLLGVDNTMSQRIIEERLAMCGLDEYLTHEEPDGEPTGAPEPSEDAAPTAEVESPAAERKKRKPAAKAKQAPKSAAPESFF